MSKRQRSTKGSLNSDLITELPEVVLSKIISLLPLKDAIRSSIVSKKWNMIWTNHPDVILDPVDIFGSSGGCVSKFIKTVNHVMFQRSKGLKMDSIALRFPLGAKNASHISQWVNCAVTKGVEKIDLDLSDGLRNFQVKKSPLTASEESELPCRLFPAPPTAYKMVKHLRLTSCRITSFPFVKILTSLVTLDLRRVSITDKRLEDLQSTCLFIERMVLHSCDDLVKFKLRNPSSRMKFLSIQNCSRIKDITLHAKNLQLFEYTGHLPLFSFKNVHKLAQVFLCFTGNGGLGGINYALNGIAYDVPQLKTLNVTCIQAITEFKLPEKVRAFGNIQRLVLSVYPFRDEDKLCWISYILKAFPMLNKLELNLFSPVFFITTLAERRDKQLPECYHQHLKELEINGYYGNKHELSLLKYLVDSAVQLDVLAINPSQKVYKGLDNWGTEETPGFVLETDRILQLHEVVPQTVQLKIL